MSVSKVKQNSQYAIAYDSKDKKKIYYHNKKGIEKLCSNDSFKPYWYGDSLIYVVGRRGSGKSTYANEYIKSYIKATKNRVFLISRLEEDPSITLPERGMRIPLDQLDQINLEDLSESLVVFDDIEDSNLTPEQRSIILNLVKDVMENSRHFNISGLITSHLATNYAKTRIILNEMSSFVIFPQYSNKYQIERVLKTYVGFKSKEIQEIFNKPSRWIHISLMPPKFVLTSNSIELY